MFRPTPQEKDAFERHEKKLENEFLASIEITPESLNQYLSRKTREGAGERGRVLITDLLSRTQKGIALKVVTTRIDGINHFIAEEREFLDYELCELQDVGLVAIVEAQRQELSREKNQVTCVYYGIPVGVAPGSVISE